MFMSCLIILISCGTVMNVFSAFLQDPDQPTPIPKPSELLKPTLPPPPPPDLSPEGCEGDHCRSSPNLIGPIVGSICGVVASVLIGLFILWFYFKRKTRKSAEITKIPEVKFIESPSLYTGAISTTESTARLYGMSPIRNNSITSHYYEKIHYNE